MARNYRGARGSVKMLRVEDLEAVLGEAEAKRVVGAVVARMTMQKPTRESIALARERLGGDRSTASREAFSSLTLRWLQDYPSEQRTFIKYLEGLEIDLDQKGAPQENGADVYRRQHEAP